MNYVKLGEVDSRRLALVLAQMEERIEKLEYGE